MLWAARVWDKLDFWRYSSIQPCPLVFLARSGVVFWLGDAGVTVAWRKGVASETFNVCVLVVVLIGILGGRLPIGEDLVCILWSGLLQFRVTRHNQALCCELRSAKTIVTAERTHWRRSWWCTRWRLVIWCLYTRRVEVHHWWRFRSSSPASSRKAGCFRVEIIYAGAILLRFESIWLLRFGLMLIVWWGISESFLYHKKQICLKCNVR